MKAHTRKAKGLMRRLKDCSDQEFLLLHAIVQLAKQLPYELVEYTRAVGDMTQRYFSAAGAPKHRNHNPSPGSVALTRDVRVAPKWGSR